MVKGQGQQEFSDGGADFSKLAKMATAASGKAKELAGNVGARISTIQKTDFTDIKRKIADASGKAREMAASARSGISGLMGPKPAAGAAEPGGAAGAAGAAAGAAEDTKSFFDNVADEEGTLSKLFNMAYMIVIGISLAALVVVIVLSIIAFAQLNKLKSKQNKLVKNNKIILRESIEYMFLIQALDVKRRMGNTEGCANRGGSKDSTGKPLPIIPIIKIDNFIIMLAATYAIILAIQIAIALFMKFREMFQKKEQGGVTDAETEKAKEKLLNISVNKKYLGLIGFSTVMAVIAYTIIVTMYVRDAINGSIRKLNDKMYILKQKVNKNLYVDTPFIEALNNDNFVSIKNMIWDKINTNLSAASSMIFTYNVYKHYTNMFTVSSPYAQDFKDAFNVNALKEKPGSGTFEPAEFLFYDDDITSLTFDDHFGSDIADDVKAGEDSINAKLRDAYMYRIVNGMTIQDNISNKLKNVNDITKDLNKGQLVGVTGTITKFVLALFIFSILVGAILISGAMMFPPIKERIVLIFQQTLFFIKNVLSKIAAALFGNK